MAIMVSPKLNWLFFILIGETFLQANEDGAYDKSAPFGKARRDVHQLKLMVDTAVDRVGDSLPPAVAQQFVTAMNDVMPYLDKFATDLDKLEQGQINTSMQIRESKWSIIAELIRLLIELAVIAALSFFTGGASATQAAVAKARSRVAILMVLAELSRRTHALPSLTEAVEEAFQTLAVRLAMMTMAPPGQRPHGINWGDVGISGVFGGLAGFFAEPFANFAKNLTNSISKALNNFPHLNTKNIRDLNSKLDPPPHRPPGNVGRNNHVPPPPPHPTPTPTPKPGPGTGPHTPPIQPPPLHPPSGGFHKALNHAGQFTAEGATESAAEFLVNGIFFGNFSTSWQTFVGSGLSERFEHGAEHLTVNSSDWLKNKLSTGPIGGATPPPLTSSTTPPPVGNGNGGSGGRGGKDGPGTQHAGNGSSGEGGGGGRPNGVTNKGVGSGTPFDPGPIGSIDGNGVDSETSSISSFDSHLSTVSGGSTDSAGSAESAGSDTTHFSDDSNGSVRTPQQTPNSSPGTGPANAKPTGPPEVVRHDHQGAPQPDDVPEDVTLPPPSETPVSSSVYDVLAPHTPGTAVAAPPPATGPAPAPVSRPTSGQTPEVAAPPSAPAPSPTPAPVSKFAPQQQPQLHPQRQQPQPEVPGPEDGAVVTTSTVTPEMPVPGATFASPEPSQTPEAPHAPQTPGFHETPDAPGPQTVSSPSPSTSSVGSADSADMIMDWEDQQADVHSDFGGPASLDGSAGQDTYHQILADLFSPGITAHPAYRELLGAVERLDTLRGAEFRPDPARDSPLSLDPVARQVLGLGRLEAVTPQQRVDLLLLALDPRAAHAGSLAALAAVHVVGQGTLTDRYAIPPNASVRGRNWTDDDPRNLDLTHTEGYEQGADGRFNSVSGPAPWHGGPEPYVVMADGGHDHVVVRGDHGPRTVSDDVFAELLALDPALSGLPADVPVVLLIQNAGARTLDVPRKAADRGGRNVWSVTARFLLDTPAPTAPTTVVMEPTPGTLLGEWVMSTPGQVLSTAAREEAPDWEGEVESQPLVHNGLSAGRLAIGGTELASTQRFLRQAPRTTELWHENRATGEFTKDPGSVPWAGRKAYFFFAHALPGRMHLPRVGKPTKVARGTEAGGFLKRRPSLAQLSDDHVVVLESCWFASAAKGDVAVGDAVPAPFVADPLSTVSDAQHTANDNDRTVFAPDRTAGIVWLPPFKRFVHILRTDALGRLGRWLEFRPEPKGTALDDVARAAALHTGDGPAPDGVREVALRLERALRLTFGPKVGEDGAYPQLLAGIGALESLRSADPGLSDATPFTMELFEHAVRAMRPPRAGADANTALTPDDYRAVLLDMAGPAPGTASLTALPLPHLVTAARNAGFHGDPAAVDAATAEVLGLPDDAAVGPAERAQFFWATVKALAWEGRTPDPDGLGAKILHLDRPDPARRGELLTTVAQAAAQGIDLDDPTALGAFHLELLGALAPETLLLTPDDRAGGRDWLGGTGLSGPVATTGITTEGPLPDGGYGPTGTAPAPWYHPGRPAPYVVQAGDGQTGLLMKLPGGATVRAPYEEVGALLARDPHLARRSMDADVVLAVPHAAAARTPAGAHQAATGPRAAVSGPTGRRVWSSSDDVRLDRPHPQAPFTVTVPGTDPNGRHAAAAWASTVPRDLRPATSEPPIGGPGTTFSAPPPTSLAQPDSPYVPDRPVPRFGGERGRYLTANQWAQLDTAGVAPRDVYGDGDCFFRALLDVVPTHLRRLAGADGDTGVNNVIGTLRNQLADELLTHQDQFTDFLDKDDHPVARIAADVATRGNYANEAGDLTPALAAQRFGLRLTIIRPQGPAAVMGPVGGVPVTLIHDTGNGPDHYLATVPARVPTFTLTPPPVDPPPPPPPLKQERKPKPAPKPGPKPKPKPAPKPAPKTKPKVPPKPKHLTPKPKTEETPPPPPPPPEQKPPLPPRPNRAPWYLSHDALGQAIVPKSMETVTFTEQQAAEWADEVGQSLVLNDPDPEDKLRTGIRDAVRDLLLTRKPRDWDDVLAVGRTLVVDGRVVWLRPMVRDLTPLRKDKAGINEYPVGFVSTQTGGETSYEKIHGFDSILFTALNLGASGAASIAAVAAPQLLVGSATTKKTSWARTVLSGRKPFINSFNPFSAGLDMHVFVDGREITPPVLRVTVPDRVHIEIPAPYSAGTEFRPDPNAPRSARPSRPRRGPNQARELLNAVNMTPLIAGLHRNLLAAGLPAPHVLKIMKSLKMDRSQGFLSESTARSRYPWWSSGDTSNRIDVNGPLGRSFRGHLRLQAEVDSIQHLGDTNVGTRDDIGAGSSHTKTSKGSSLGGFGAGYNTAGISGGADASTGGIDPDTAHPDDVEGSKGFEIKGVAPAVGFTVAGDRAGEHALDTGHLSHTVLNIFGDQTRYQSGLRLVATMESTTHNVRPVTVTTDSELSVPKREAAQFVEGLAGPGWTPELRPAGGDADAPRQKVYTRPAPRRLRTLPTRRSPFRFPLHPYPDRTPPAAHPSEPRVLAARRGFGFSMPIAIAGAESVQPDIRAAIEQHHTKAVGAKKVHKSDWADADRDLGMFFGRAALEADPHQAVLGIHRTIEVGGRAYKVSAKMRWGDRVNGPNPMADAVDADADPEALKNNPTGESYKMKVNARGVTGATVTGERGKTGKFHFAFGGGARLAVPELEIGHLTTPPFRLALGAFRGLISRSWGKTNKFKGLAKGYRRTETAGHVDEHRYRMTMQWTVTPEAGRPSYIGGRNHVVARVVTPHEHRPRTTVTVPEARAAGRAHYGNTLASVAPDPKQRPLDFGSGTHGIYPAFHMLPELAQVAAEMYAAQHRLPKSWLGDPAGWPEEIRDLAHPIIQGSRFNELAGPHGDETELPKDGHHKQAFRVKLHSYETENLGASPDVEVEQYAQSAATHESEKDRGWAFGVGGSVGPQFRFGSDASEEHADGPGGRLTLLGFGSLSRQLGNGEGDLAGQIDITRATYSGDVHTVRTTPVFEVTYVRWRGDKLTETTRFVRLDEALDLLVPDKRLTDLTPPAEKPAPKTEPPQKTESTPTNGSSAKAGSTPTTGTPLPPPPAQPARTYLSPDLITGIGHPETLRADGVLDTIVQRLRGQGVIATESGPGHAPRPNLLMRSLRSSFSSDALQTETPALSTNQGVSRWYPVPGPLGTTRYLWVKVTATRLGPAHDQQPRDDIKLTLRGESEHETSEHDSTGWEFSGGADARARAGDPELHGGIEGGVEYSGSGGTTDSDAEKTVTIYRANPSDKSEEFNHEIVFKVETGLTTELPEFLSSPARGIDKLIRVVSGAPTRDKGVFHWFDAGDGTPGNSPLVEGSSIRLLVPRHLTAETDQPPRAIDLTRPRETEVTWHPAPSTAPSTAGPPARPPAPLPQALVDNLHPWSVPAAAPIGRWAALTAVRHRTPPTLDLAHPPRIDGLNFHTRSGLRYQHFTGGNMLRPHIKELLRHTYTVPVGDRDTTVGLELAGAEILGAAEGNEIKQRTYQQNDEAPKHDIERERGWKFAFGPEAGGSLGEHKMFDRLPVTIKNWVNGVKRSSALGDTDERNKEGKRPYRLYRFDVVAVIKGPHGTVRVRVPGGLYGGLPVNKETGLLEDGLEELLHGLTAVPTPVTKDPIDPGDPKGPPDHRPISQHVFDTLTGVGTS